jgi:lysine decarboxylase
MEIEMKYTQQNTPIHEALLKHRKDRIVHFDVPGHKGERGTPELTQFLGIDCLKADVNSMKPLDNLVHPVGVIKAAEELAAEAFGADAAFLMVNGTTSAVQSMIMSTCKSGDKIIMPRNVHRSSINALVVCGAIPVYVNPGVNHRLGIPLGMSLDEIKKAISENPEAKAILVNNPTYYGICSNLFEIVKLAHENGMKVLVDEAHGAHFYFGEGLPISAMAAGADMAAVSMHKTGGSLTQSSFLLCKNDIDPGYVRQIINLTQTTSGSYLLMSSLDIARKYMHFNGKEVVAKTLELSEYARNEINKLGGYYAFSSDIVDGDTIFNFDRTKLSVHTADIGLAGIEIFDLLLEEYDIQVEFGDIGNFLAIISAGDRAFEIERLISALSELKRRYGKDKVGMLNHEYIDPDVVFTPQKAFYHDKKSVPLREGVGHIAGEFVMCYPPGIPILAPGERITKDIIEYIIYAKEKGSVITGPKDMKIEYINIIDF